MNAVDTVRNRLAFMLVAAFVFMMPFLLYKTLPEGNKDIITYMVGQLSGMALMALGHYFTNRAGQDTIDEKRADNTGKLAEAVVAAAKASPPDQKEAAAQAAEKVADAAGDAADRIKDQA